MTTENVLTLHLTPRVADHDYYAIEERVAQLPGRAGGRVHPDACRCRTGAGSATFTITGRPRGRTADRRSSATSRRATSRRSASRCARPARDGSGRAAEAPRVILINEALARAHFRDDDPIGRETDRGTIVGVVGDVRQARLDRPADPGDLLRPVQTATPVSRRSGHVAVVSTSGAPEAIVPADPRGGARGEPDPGDLQRQDDGAGRGRFAVGAESLSVADRAVRRAGAGAGRHRPLRRDLVRRDVAHAASSPCGWRSDRIPPASRAWCWSAGCGWPRSAWCWARLARWPAAAAAAVFRRASSPDVTTFAAIALLIAAIAFVACLVPALRVAAVNPATVLRHD